MRMNVYDDEKLDVQMSPLIDCVFLLLIFFLVTTMMKKWEMQIPLELPSITSSLSTTKDSESAVVLSVNGQGTVYHIVNQDRYSGESAYRRIADVDAFLDQLQASKGNGVTVEVTAYRDVPVETVIGVFDKCQIHGFQQTRVRLGSKLP